MKCPNGHRLKSVYTYKKTFTSNTWISLHKYKYCTDCGRIYEVKADVGNIQAN